MRELSYLHGALHRIFSFSLREVMPQFLGQTRQVSLNDRAHAAGQIEAKLHCIGVTFLRLSTCSLYRDSMLSNMVRSLENRKDCDGIPLLEQAFCVSE